MVTIKDKHTAEPRPLQSKASRCPVFIGKWPSNIWQEPLVAKPTFSNAIAHVTESVLYIFTRTGGELSIECMCGRVHIVQTSIKLILVHFKLT